MEYIDKILGVGAEATQLSFVQILLRGLVVVLVTIAVIRIAGRRFIAHRNPTDVMMAFIVSSMLARAINGNAVFWGTLGGGVVVAVFYRILTFWACKFDGLGSLIKGRPDVLIKDGEVQRKAMNRHQISQNDLMEDLHLNGHVTDTGDVMLARIERSGDISVLRKPQAFNVHIENGVQTVRDPNYLSRLEAIILPGQKPAPAWDWPHVDDISPV